MPTLRESNFLLFQTVAWDRWFVMDAFFATVGLVAAVGTDAGQWEQVTEAVTAGSRLALTVDVTAIATVGLVLAFSYGIIKSFRDKP